MKVSRIWDYFPTFRIIVRLCHQPRLLMPLFLRLFCDMHALDGTACAYNIRTLVPTLSLNMKERSGFVIAGGKQYSRQSTLFPLF